MCFRALFSFQWEEAEGIKFWIDHCIHIHVRMNNTFPVNNTTFKLGIRFGFSSDEGQIFCRVSHVLLRK